ncbi:MAG: YHYH protein, partial [archaeon]|nr:YHYH protein [archaeon]
TASPVIGVAYDGYPIYGLLEVGDDGVLHEVTSSYRLKEGGTGYNGIDDYEFVEGLGDLDVCNGHFGPTADFPEGIYHYHSTMENGEGGMGFPYFLICYRGTVVDAAVTGADAGDDPCAGHGETWGPGIGPPPEGCDQGPPPTGQSTEVTRVHPLTFDASFFVVALIIATWTRRRSG